MMMMPARFKLDTIRKLRRRGRWAAIAAATITHFAWRTAPVAFLLLVVAVLGCHLMPFAALWASRHAIDAVIQTLHGDPAQGLNGATTVEIWVVVLVTVSAVRGLARSVATFSTRNLDDQLRTGVEAVVLKDAGRGLLSAMPSNWELRLHAGAAANCAGLLSKACWGAGDFLVFTMCILWLAWFNVTACGFVLVAVLPLLLLELQSARPKQRSAIGSGERGDRRPGILDSMLGDERCLRELRVFRAEDRFRARNIEDGRIARADGRVRAKRHVWVALALTSLAALSYYMAYAMIVKTALDGACSVGAMAFYLGITRRASNSSDGVVGGLVGTMRYAVFAVRFSRHLRSRPAGRPMLPGPSRTGEQGLRLDNIGLRQAGGEEWECRHVSLLIRPGERVAIVEAAGAGKTSLLQVLAGVRSPDEGRVLLDGHDLRRWDPLHLNERISVKFRDPARFPLTLRESVALSELASASDEMRIERALLRAGEGMLLNTLPRALDTPLRAKNRERVLLNRRQWDGVALARCFFREQADILILEDPLPSWETREDQSIWDQAAVAGDHTTVIIATDRPGIILGAGRLIVLANGRVVADGRTDVVVPALDGSLQTQLGLVLEKRAKRKRDTLVRV